MLSLHWLWVLLWAICHHWVNWWVVLFCSLSVIAFSLWVIIGYLHKSLDMRGFRLSATIYPAAVLQKIKDLLIFVGLFFWAETYAFPVALTSDGELNRRARVEFVIIVGYDSQPVIKNHAVTWMRLKCCMVWIGALVFCTFNVNCFVLWFRYKNLFAPVTYIQK